jgi:hypothetical protein
MYHGFYHDSNSDFIATIVDAWMYGKTINASDNDYGLSHTFNGNKANQFVCYLSGHEHQDGVNTLPNYNKQVDITFDCTCSFYNQLFNDLPRTTNEKKKIDDSVTLFSFDPENRRINLCRLGSDITRDGRERKYANFALPYI